MKTFLEGLKEFLSGVAQLPVIAPIIGLLRSRAVVLGLLTFAVNFLLAHNPEFEQFRDPLNTLVALIIGKMGIEDGAEKLGAWLLAKEAAKGKVG